MEFFLQSPQKNHNDDDARYPPYDHTRNNNSYDNDHHRRTPTRLDDDDQYEPPLPHTTHRQPLISSSTQVRALIKLIPSLISCARALPKFD